MSLAPWSLHIAVDPTHTVEIPGRPAIDWLEYLLEADLDGVVSNLMPEIEDFYFDNELDIVELYRLSLDVITAVCARPWWIGLRIIMVVKDGWNILGPKMIMKQIDPTRISLAAWLDVALYLIIENMEPKDVTMFTMKLELPPPEIFGRVIEVEEPTMDRNAFLAFGE